MCHRYSFIPAVLATSLRARAVSTRNARSRYRIRTEQAANLTEATTGGTEARGARG
jgi:hypothetical protein